MYVLIFIGIGELLLISSFVSTINCKKQCIREMHKGVLCALSSCHLNLTLQCHRFHRFLFQRRLSVCPAALKVEMRIIPNMNDPCADDQSEA